ncbi:hypothetical protein VITFI_CDS0304 [Vitreoscilla filiformis]|uniref:Uncharacterized protein n=1 Tax=Vitreoscilla filiformis TaxID=63 RepID=A0A221KB82_VITFI|nr:hypothetical protein VITFI_CDS0304 [Vitreoscilla filiformis]
MTIPHRCRPVHTPGGSSRLGARGLVEGQRCLNQRRTRSPAAQ